MNSKFEKRPETHKYKGMPKEAKRDQDSDSMGSLADFICDDEGSAAEEGTRIVKEMFADRK